MAEPKESRLAEILRAELKAGKGLAEALSTSYKERAKERSDLRRMFPQYGVLGQVMRSVGGSAYKYGAPKSVAEKKEQKEKTVANVAVKMMARNTSVLPAMARDMNIMKRNMQELVSIWGNRKITRAESGYLRVGQKRATPQTKQGGSTTQPRTNSLLGNVAGGLFGAASFATDLAGGLIKGVLGVLGTGLKLGGGLLLGAASVLGSLFSGVIGIGGGLIGGLFRGLASAVSGMGLFGLIALAGVGFLTYQMSKSIKGTLDFDNIYETLKEKFKSFFDVKEGESFRDIVMKALGNFDEKTGLNTRGAFEGIERLFAKWFTYSTSIMTSIVSVMKDVGELSLLEMRGAFLKFGTMIVTLVGELTGIFLGGKAMLGVGSALAGNMLARGGGAGSAIGALLSFAGAVGVGAFGGKLLGDRISETVNAFLMTNAGSFNPEQLAVLNEMQTNEKFIKEMNTISGFSKAYQKATKDGDDVFAARYKKKIEEHLNSDVVRSVREKFEKAFPGMKFDANKSLNEQMIEENENRIKEVKERLGKTSLESIREQADVDSEIAESRKYEEQRESRSRAPTREFDTSSSNSMEKLRDLIARGESRGDYNIANKKVGNNYPQVKDLELTRMTVGDVLREQLTKRIFAAGRYQFTYDTLRRTMDLAGVGLSDKFDEKTQDRLADALIKDTLKGKKTTEEKRQALAKVWRALEYTPGKSYSQVMNPDSVDRATVSVAEIDSLLGGPNISPSMYADASKKVDIMEQYEKEKREENKEFSEYFKESMDRAFGLSAAAAADSSVQGKSQTELLAMVVTELREVKSRISSGSTTSTVDQNFIKTYERITGIA